MFSGKNTIELKITKTIKTFKSSTLFGKGNTVCFIQISLIRTMKPFRSNLVLDMCGDQWRVANILAQNLRQQGRTNPGNHDSSKDQQFVYIDSYLRYGMVLCFQLIQI